MTPPSAMRPSGERGEGSLEVVLVMPVLILLIASVIQFALWSHATHVAVAAAQEGAEQARLDGATAEDGRARAEDFLTQAAPRLIAAREVTVTRDAQVATVVVRGRVASVVPGLDLPVRGNATGIVERFRPATEGR
jgi:Flp pilus assembly protein TadG